MSLTSDVQQSLEYLKSYPTRPAARTWEMPIPFARDLQRHILYALRTHPDEIDHGAMQQFEHPFRPPEEMHRFYSALLAVGVEDDESLKRFLLWFLDNHFLGVPLSAPLTNGEQMILDLVSSQYGSPQRLVDYELIYALENHLCHYGEGIWSLTGLGRAVLRLPSLQATRFLLALEVFLHAGMWDEWHMSRDFLERLLTGRQTESISQHEPHDVIVREYLERLQEFGLISQLPAESEFVQVSELGKLTISSVLARDSAFDALVPLYVRQEIVATEIPDFASDEDAERIRVVLETSPIVGESKQPILDEIARLRQPNAPYLSVFKALAPCVEAILRDLTTIEGLPVNGLGLAAVVKAIKEAPKPLLKTGTLQMIDEVFRPYRNMIAHGSSLAPEPARMLCEISLLTIEQIHKDYAACKG